MKTKREKYEEAVTRNMKTFRSRGTVNPDIVKETLESLKTRIGIRRQDTGYDVELSTAISAAQKSVEKIEKKAKEEMRIEKKTDKERHRKEKTIH